MRCAAAAAAAAASTSCFGVYFGRGVLQVHVIPAPLLLDQTLRDATFFNNIFINKNSPWDKLFSP